MRDLRTPILESLGKLDLAYAATIHKSQGAEHAAVLLNIQRFHGQMLKRSILYTGITRAKLRLQLVGEWDAVVRAVRTLDTEQRKTLLAARIVELNGM